MKQRAKKLLSLRFVAVLASVTIFSQGCMRFLTHNRDEVVLNGIDIDQTLKVAEYELNRGKLGASLTVWALRDQVITADQAEKVVDLYFSHVGDLRNFDEWHITWAISNMYRLSEPQVKPLLVEAYVDAIRRAENLHRLAERLAKDNRIFMGDAYSGGRAYAQKHLVVPGNTEYLQSFDQFLENKKNRRENKTGENELCRRC